MSNANKFQTAQEVTEFMAQLQGMLKDPRLTDLAEQADLAGDSNLKGELLNLAQVFGKVANAS